MERQGALSAAAINIPSRRARRERPRDSSAAE
jgi:hypothetical protein